ncbi:hypothetical protein M3P05_00500 [Sansalvadorimonas sp. 2012CJ34-2]|uniref:Uncharacterized protein n=1 Tax=Parendozoicomonas callyspongiae TaxID=2942213 RepID=A0ABT0PAK9_9GAMM|nr:hypothetical protein [Sansalvadorimonas sp. 2012CJ34-2]MCL6268429.1 hypothetical protein [Sansalvadorimonas sp. 2012CJ34-2]
MLKHGRFGPLIQALLATVLMNFEKKTEVSGWDFRAIVVLVNNRVVFKIWSGTPNILEYSNEKNPLGPIQGASDYLLD